MLYKRYPKIETSTIRYPKPKGECQIINNQTLLKEHVQKYDDIFE